MSTHADFEALSAFVDGEAPEWGPHVDGCEACRATVAELRALQGAVGAPVEPVDPAARDRAIAAAMAGSARPLVERSTPARQPLRWLVPASIAALFAVVVGAASLLSQGGGSDDQFTTAGPALESAPSADTAVDPGSSRSSSSSGASSNAAAASGDLGSLGEIPDAATLLARARPGLLTKGAPAAVASPESPAPSTLGGSGAAAAPGDASGQFGSSGAAGAAVVGTRPCEEQARAREPALREVVYFATASRRGVPAFVLGFSTGPEPAPVTLLLLAQDGCGVLLRAAGP